MEITTKQGVETRPGRIFLLRGWLGIAGLAPLCVAVVLSQTRFAEGTYGDFAADVLGALLIVLGVAWRTWAMFFIGGRKTRSLVCEGPYSMCRHPLYFGSLLIGIGAGVMLQSITGLIGFLILFPLIYLPVIAEEERALAANHGGEHGEFIRKVPNRILPKISAREAGSTYVEIHLRAQWNQAKRSLLTLAAIPALELVQMLRSNGVLPVWLNLP